MHNCFFDVLYSHRFQPIFDILLNAGILDRRNSCCCGRIQNLGGYSSSHLRFYYHWGIITIVVVITLILSCCWSSIGFRWKYVSFYLFLWLFWYLLLLSFLMKWRRRWLLLEMLLQLKIDWARKGMKHFIYGNSRWWMRRHSWFIWSRGVFRIVSLSKSVFQTFNLKILSWFRGRADANTVFITYLYSSTLSFFFLIFLGDWLISVAILFTRYCF